MFYRHEMERVRAAAANRAATSNEQLEYLQGLDPGLHAHYQALMGLRTAPPAAVSSQPPPAATSAPAPATSSSAARSAPAQPTPAGSYLLKRLFVVLLCAVLVQSYMFAATLYTSRVVLYGYLQVHVSYIR